MPQTLMESNSQGATTAGQYGTAVGRLAVASNYGATAIMVLMEY